MIISCQCLKHKDGPSCIRQTRLKMASQKITFQWHCANPVSERRHLISVHYRDLLIHAVCEEQSDLKR